MEKTKKKSFKFTLPKPYIGGLEKDKIYLIKSKPMYSETEVLEILKYVIKFHEKVWGEVN